MRQSVFPPLFNMQRVVFTKEKQTHLAISPPPPPLRTLNRPPNWASLRRRHSKPPGQLSSLHIDVVTEL